MKQILIIEDNALNMRLFTDLLVANGYDVVGISDGHQVMVELNATKYDLIIMDIQLPEISGIDLIKQIKADSRMASIPIIAVTAFAMKADKDMILEAGCEDYIAKPISITNFMDIIQKYV